MFHLFFDSTAHTIHSDFASIDSFALYVTFANRSTPLTISAPAPAARIESPPSTIGARVIQPPGLSTVPENNGIPDANAADFKRRSMLALNADSMLQLPGPAPEQSARNAPADNAYQNANGNAGAPSLDSPRNAPRVIAAPPATTSLLNRSLSMPFRTPDSMVHSMSEASNVTSLNGRAAAGRPALRSRELNTSPTPSQSTSVSTLSNTFGSFAGAWRPAAGANATGASPTVSATAMATAGDSSNFVVRLRPDAQGRFGFNIKGGSDQQTPVIVSKIAAGMPADLTIPRLTEGDELLQANGRDASTYTHNELVAYIRQLGQSRGDLLLLVRASSFYLTPALLYLNASPESLSNPALYLSALAGAPDADAMSEDAVITEFEQSLRRTRASQTRSVSPSSVSASAYPGGPGNRSTSPLELSPSALYALSVDYLRQGVQSGSLLSDFDVRFESQSHHISYTCAYPSR